MARMDVMQQMRQSHISGHVVLISVFVTLSFLLVAGGLYSLAEGWSFLTGVYFTMVTLSTTGYGDKFPRSTPGRLLNVTLIFISFCGLFVLFRFIISYMVDQNLTRIVTAVKERRKALRETAYKHGLSFAPLTRFVLTANDADATLEHEAAVGLPGSPHESDAVKVEEQATDRNGAVTDVIDAVLHETQMEMSKLDPNNGIAAELGSKEERAANARTRANTRTAGYGCVYFLWLVLWATFYCSHKKERKEFDTFWKGLYFGIITSSTIGYGGEDVPQSDAGRLFAAVFLLIGVISFAVFAGHLSETVVSTIMGLIHKHMASQSNPKASKKKRRARYMLNRMLLDAYSGKAIDRCDYVTNMLIAAGRVSRDEVQELIKQFDEADEDNDGCLDMREIKRMKTATDLFKLGSFYDVRKAHEAKASLLNQAMRNSVMKREIQMVSEMEDRISD